MNATKRIRILPLLLSLAISLGTGALAGALTSGSMDVYDTLNRPALSPPGVVFPIVWSVLYTLMGLSAYLIYVSGAPGRRNALILYGVQLVINFIWPLLFFGIGAYWLSFFWLVVLWITMALMAASFYRIRPLAAYLQIPYLLWVAFAGYLNVMTAILN